MERPRQTTDTRHQLFHHQPAANMQIEVAEELHAHSLAVRLVCGSGKTDVPASAKMGLEVAESLPAGSGEDWLCWRTCAQGWACENSDEEMGLYLDYAQSVDCDSGDPQTMAHLLSRRLLDEACTADDLATVTERPKACARKWGKFCERHEKRRTELQQRLHVCENNWVRKIARITRSDRRRIFGVKGRDGREEELDR